MGQLADRLAFLTRRYGSDPAAWQHELHALSSLEEHDVKAAVERFHLLKRRLAEFRRAQLLRELRTYPFAEGVPAEDARGYPLSEVEADVREATRALAHARAISAAISEERIARGSLRLRPSGEAAPRAAARWDALAPLEAATEARRRVAAREARLEQRLATAQRRIAKLARTRLQVPDPALEADALSDALDALEPKIARAEALEAAHRASIAPLKAPEVRTFRDESRRKLEREADARADAGDEGGLHDVRARAEALRQEAARLSAEAARGRRRGAGPPPRERRPGDPIDPYG